MEKTSKSVTNIVTIIKDGIIALFFALLITITVLGVLKFRSFMNETSEGKLRNADILNNLAAFTHVDYVEENKLIEGEINDMSAMIFAERHIKISRKNNLTVADGAFTLLRDEEYVSMRLFAAQDYTLDLDVNIDRDNNRIVVTYPSNIFILSYDFDDHIIKKNPGQEAKEVGSSIVDSAKHYANTVTDYYIGEEYFDESHEDSLMKMLELVKNKEAIQMESKWKEIIIQDMATKYGNFDVTFKNTNPIVITEEQQDKLTKLIIVPE